MSAIIRDDPKGEIQGAIDAIVKRAVELQLGLLAPCLINGHTKEESTFDSRFRIIVHLCSVCGSIYQEPEGK